MLTDRRRDGAITDVPGVTVGHYTDAVHATGCTVVLADAAVAAGVDVRGGATATRELALLDPLATVARANAILLTGGSAFGLDAAAGVMRFLEARGSGARVGGITVPIVPAAAIFDLGLITADARPTADDAFAACQAAGVYVAQGSVGAGAGAAIGSLRGRERAVKGGVGTASVSLDGGAVVGAIVVVNPLGSVVDPADGVVLAGPWVRRGKSVEFEDSVRILIEDPPKLRALPVNTVIGVVATNVALDRQGVGRLAAAGQDAIALAVRPAHTSSDGDTVFAIAAEQPGAAAHQDRLRAAATEAVVGAIINAALEATGIGGVSSVRELTGGD